MKPDLFVKTYLPFAEKVETETGISKVAILAQAALESGWGDKVKGNNFFGIKSFKSTDKRQLITTTEILSSPDVKFPEVISVDPITVKGKQAYKYTVKDWFMAYDTPEGSFLDHSKFLKVNHNYSKALLVKSDPEKFLTELAKAGYATAPDYANLLIQIVHMIKKLL